MVEIRELDGGRYEVYAADRHCEAFEGPLGAIAVAHAVAADIAQETQASVMITSPWGDRSVSEARAIEIP